MVTLRIFIEINTCYRLIQHHISNALITNRSIRTLAQDKENTAQGNTNTHQNPQQLLGGAMGSTMHIAAHHGARLAVLLCLSFGLLSSHFPSQLERILDRGELLVGIRSLQAVKENSRDNSFDFQLLTAFAENLGVTLKLQNEGDLARLQYSIAKEKVDLGVSDAGHNPLFPVRSGLPYLFIKQQLVYKKGQEIPKNPEDLVGKKIYVEYGSHHADSLRQIQSQHPELRWDEVSNMDSLALIEAVQRGDIDYAVVNSNIYDISRRLFPEVRVAFSLSESQDIAWDFSHTKDNSLFNAAADFIQEAFQDGKLEQLTAEHYGHIKKMDYTDAVAFYRRVQTRLPQWQELLQQSAQEHKLDWNLLAAISYQESHWNKDAKSYTGVRGLMMLTKATARDMKIADRTDPAQSIEGGARYFKSIFKRLPEGIQGDDRSWFALAAYNVGFAHLEDARVLTQRLGGNPNQWNDVKKNLPLLSKKEYYRTLKYGYARGREPVKYVQNIRQYYDILAWQDDIRQSRIASSNRPDTSIAKSVKVKQDDRDLSMSLL